jgi:hypothetical protein
MANSTKFQVKDGLMIRFWFYNWSEGCLVDNFRLLSTFAPDIITSCHEVKQQGRWDPPFRLSLTQEAQTYKIRLLAAIPNPQDNSQENDQTT